jgi:hypothetical protein
MQGFIEDSDQNLKYLGLVGLVDLMKVFSFVLLLKNHDVILICVSLSGLMVLFDFFSYRLSFSPFIFH